MTKRSAAPLIDTHLDFSAMPSLKLDAAEVDVANRIAAAEAAGDSLARAHLETRLRLLHAERARRNGNSGRARKSRAKRLVMTMDQIEEEVVDFLWKNRIPRGKLTLFDGDPGIGKSTAASAIVAALSAGVALPLDVEPEAPLRSLILSAEDSAGDTLKPRLRRMGADMSMIGIPERASSPRGINADSIEQMLKEFPAALLVLDPVIAYASRRNTDRAGDVRDFLTPLVLIAEKHKTAMILIRHLTKNSQLKALYRGQGSIDFAAACRSIFVFAQDQENPERRLMAHVKASLSSVQPTLEFFINRETGAFSWGKETAESADEALGTGAVPRQRERAQTDAAEEFLKQILANGPKPSTEIRSKADQAGIAWRTVWRAKGPLNIRASKERGSGEWFWRLP